MIVDLLAICGADYEQYQVNALDERSGCLGDRCQTCFGNTWQRREVFNMFRHFWATTILSQLIGTRRRIR